MPVSYPLDLSGISPANLVSAELHSVNEAHFRDYYFIVPQLAPFYVDNFRLYITVGGVDTLLTEDVDYSFALPYVTGTRTTGKQMYGAVTMHDVEATGILKLTYQTVGGDQVCDRLQVLSILADKAYNPRTTIWDIVSNLPASFPPTPHYQDYDSISGQTEVIAALTSIRDAILANSSLTSSVIESFLFDFNQGSSTAYIKKTGDTMLAPLELNSTPTSDLHATNKQYVDSVSISETAINSLLSAYASLAIMNDGLNEKLSKTGGIMTGQIKLVGPPLADEDAARKKYVDDLLAAQASTIQALQTTISDMQAVGTTKQYVDDQIATLLALINNSGP